MSLLDKASLIVTPNAYEESKLYSVVPNTTLGDMDVVRATTATRVNSAGLIEVVPRNLVFYSEQFDNVNWSLISTTVTSNATTAPNSTLTADRIQISSSSNARIQQVSTGTNLTIGRPYTFSCWIKSISGTGKVGIRSGQNGVSAIWSFTNEWVRYTFTSNATAINEVPQLCNNTLVTGADAAPDFYVWGFQIDNGSLTEYFPTTTRLNIPRIDYTNGSCPSLLVEPQRTNLTLYSEQFDNAYWIKDIDVTVNSNVSISPSGNLDADRVNFASNNKAIYKNITATGTHRFSIYLKGEGSNIGKQIQLLIGNVGGTVNVTLTSQWQRFTTDASTSTYVGVSKVGALQADSVLIWGSQLEAGSYPTSYIPTIASTVTRNADVISKTGISSLIGQTEGTVFADFNITNNDLSGDKTIFAVDDNSYYVNIIAPRILNNNVLNITFRANSVAITFTNLPTLTNGNHKIAIKYGNGFASVFVDGVFRSTKVWTNSFSSSISQLFIGKNRIELPYFNDRIKSVQLYKTALTDQECINLTTL